MPLYMDIHELRGETSEDIAKAHVLDLKTQQKYGVDYKKYWIDEGCGKAFCLVEASSPEDASRVHREAHGHVAEKIIEVEPDLAEGFLGGGKVHSSGAVLLPGGAGDTRDPGIRTVLFTDIVGSTSITQTVGDDAAMHLLAIHDEIVRNALASLGGREVKHTGDGIMASFVSAVAAVRCAAQIQQEIVRQDARQHPIQVRIGLAAGEPVDHRDDLFGSTVQLAARLCSHAEPKQILASNAIAELCLGKLLPFRELGEINLKGFDHPVRAHSVRWMEESVQESAT